MDGRDGGDNLVEMGVGVGGRCGMCNSQSGLGGDKIWSVKKRLNKIFKKLKYIWNSVFLYKVCVSW